MIQNLGQSKGDYLECILLLHNQGAPVRITDLALKMDVKKSSAVSAVKQLEEKTLVVHHKYGQIELTDKGKQVAEKIYKRHKTLTDFFHKYLSIPHEIAENNACSIEHSLDDVTMRQLEKLIDKLDEKGIVISGDSGE